MPCSAGTATTVRPAGIVTTWQLPVSLTSNAASALASTGAALKYSR
jgi:hypothetical protein